MRATLETAIENKSIVRMMINDSVRLLEGINNILVTNTGADKCWCLI